MSMFRQKKSTPAPPPHTNDEGTERPGRRNLQTMTPETDHRIDPKLLACLRELGLSERTQPLPLRTQLKQVELVETVRLAEQGFSDLYASLPNALTGDKQVTFFTEFIPSGVDDHEIEVRVYRSGPAHADQPCLIYLHGGGMTILDAFSKVHDRWCQDLALKGHIVVSVDFRNAYAESGLNPFPVGLQDCLSAIMWVHDNRTRLGISKIILQGESGGANLAIASAMMAKKQEAFDVIAGVYASVPYISGAYGWPEDKKKQHLPSLFEFDGYFVDCSLLDLLVGTYDPQDTHCTDPFCWPYFASMEDLQGLPPHAITVNELDPLRDEGLAFYRKLRAAGVPVRAHTKLGLTHAADLIFRAVLPDIYFAGIADISEFVRSL